MASASIDSTKAWAERKRIAPPTTKRNAMAQPASRVRRKGPSGEAAGRSSISSISPSRGGTRVRSQR